MKLGKTLRQAERAQERESEREIGGYEMCKGVMLRIVGKQVKQNRNASDICKLERYSKDTNSVCFVLNATHSHSRS